MKKDSVRKKYVPWGLKWSKEDEVRGLTKYPKKTQKMAPSGKRHKSRMGF